jgi:elongation factor P
MAVKATEVRKGQVIQKDGDLLLITEYQHKTPGNLRAIIQIKVKSILSGATQQLRLGSNDMLEVAFLDRKKSEYLYREGTGPYIFMDSETYEQFPLEPELVGEKMGYVKENTVVEVTFHSGTPIGVVLSPTVVLEVVEAEAAVKGNTATNVKKSARVETGIEVKVPLHINAGDRIKVSTEDGEFMGRAND